MEIENLTSLSSFAVAALYETRRDHIVCRGHLQPRQHTIGQLQKKTLQQVSLDQLASVQSQWAGEKDESSSQDGSQSSHDVAIEQKITITPQKDSQLLADRSRVQAVTQSLERQSAQRGSELPERSRSSAALFTLPHWTMMLARKHERPKTVSSGSPSRPERQAMQLGDVVSMANRALATMKSEGVSAADGAQRPNTAPEPLTSGSQFEKRTAQIIGAPRVPTWSPYDSQTTHQQLHEGLSSSIDWRGAVTPPPASNAIVSRIFKGHSYLKKSKLLHRAKEKLLPSRTAVPLQVTSEIDSARSEDNELPWHINGARGASSGLDVAAPFATAMEMGTAEFGSVATTAPASAAQTLVTVGAYEKHSNVPKFSNDHSKTVKGRSKKGVSFRNEDSVYYYDLKPKFTAAFEYISFVGSLATTKAQRQKANSSAARKREHFSSHASTGAGVPMLHWAGERGCVEEQTDILRLDERHDMGARKSPDSIAEASSTSAVLRITTLAPAKDVVNSRPLLMPATTLDQRDALTTSLGIDAAMAMMASGNGSGVSCTGSLCSGHLASAPLVASRGLKEAAAVASPLVRLLRTPPSISRPHTLAISPQVDCGFHVSHDGRAEGTSSPLTVMPVLPVGIKEWDNTYNESSELRLANQLGVETHLHASGLLRADSSPSDMPRSASARARKRPVQASFSPRTYSYRPIPDVVEAEDKMKTLQDCERLRRAKAAVDIQRVFRGYVARRLYLKLLKEYRAKEEDKRLAAVEIQRCYRKHVARTRNIYKQQPRGLAKSLAWSRAYTTRLLKEDLRRKQAAEEVAKEDQKNHIQLHQVVSVIGPHIDMYMIFHPPKEGPTAKEMNDAAVVIQKHFRGWRLRDKLQKLQAKVQSQYANWLTFVQFYRTYLAKLAKLTGKEKPSVTVNLDQMDKFVIMKKRYESVFDKRSFGNELDEEELNLYFKECDLFPGVNEVEHAMDLIVKGKRRRRKHTLTKQEVLDITFQIYMPEGTGLADTRKSTWLHPIINGEDALKMTSSSLIEPTPLGPCLRLVSESRKERREAAIARGEKDAPELAVYANLSSNAKH